VTSDLPSAAGVAAVVARLAVLPLSHPWRWQWTGSPAARALLAVFDVVVTTRDELDAVLAAVARTPLAAATLVHVLRAGAGLVVSDALAVESLAYAALQGGREFASWLRARPGTTPRSLTGTPAVLVEREGDGLAITLARPERHNAFSARMRDELVDALAGCRDRGEPSRSCCAARDRRSVAVAISTSSGRFPMRRRRISSA